MAKQEAEIQYAIALSLHQQKNDAVKAQAISLEVNIVNDRVLTHKWVLLFLCGVVSGRGIYKRIIQAHSWWRYPFFVFLCLFLSLLLFNIITKYLHSLNSKAPFFESTDLDKELKRYLFFKSWMHPVCHSTESWYLALQACVNQLFYIYK